MPETRQPCLTFRVGHQWFGVRVTSIIEVLHLVALTELPAAPTDVLGLLTIRDMVMPVVDLRTRFGHTEVALRLDTHLVAIQTPSGPVALVVDDVEKVMEISAQQSSDSLYVQGLIRLEDHLILLLNIERIRQETQIDSLAALSEV